MISEDYKNTLAKIHASSPFGKRSKLPPYLDKWFEKLQPTTVLDFGCGKGRLKEALNDKYPHIEVIQYDPAVPEFDIDLNQVKVDMVISTDVLEHIEPKHLHETLNQLKSVSSSFYHLISCAPAKLILPDGRNAHLIQKEPQWWRKQFSELGYDILQDEYREVTKYSKSTKKDIQVKNFFVMGIVST